MRGKIGNQEAIRSLLKENNIHVKKQYGQNFLTDQNVLSNITTASEADKDTLVIEIGPGLGSLTEHLCNAAGFVLCYEIDEELIPVLKENLKRYDNFEVINQDILEADINADIEKYRGNLSKVYIVANLPYYITTPIILGMLEKTDKITRYVMMMQKEVADRITSRPKTKDYNALSIVIGYRAQAKKVLFVPRTVFIPSPNVDSAVVRLDLYPEKKYFPKNEEHFFKFIRECFSQRRKTLSNNLSGVYGKDAVTEMIDHFGYKPSIRAEELDIADFIAMSDYLQEKSL